MDREAAVALIREQLANDDAQAARAAFCRTATEAIAHAGHTLHAAGYMLRDERADGVGLAARIAGSLSAGSCVLLSAGNAYAAAALIRQVVEVEYLFWTFADDPEDAARWINASKSQLASTFRPATMRNRSQGRFRSGEYSSHCDRGGHPTPHARMLISASAPLDPVRSMWTDLGQHLESAWGLLLQACAAIDRSAATEPRIAEVEQARSVWHESDALAPRSFLVPL